MKLAVPPRHVQKILESCVREAFAHPEDEKDLIVMALSLLLAWHGFKDSIRVSFYPTRKKLDGALGRTCLFKGEVEGVDLILPSKYRRGARDYLGTLAHEALHVVAHGHSEDDAEHYETLFKWGKK